MKRVECAPSRLPAECLRLEEQIRDRVYGIDRLSLVCDSQQQPHLPASIKRHCGNVKVSRTPCEFQRSYPWQISLYQPTRRALKALRTFLGRRFSVKIFYVELACDFLVEDANDADAIKVFLLGHISPKSMRHPVVIQNGTAYFSRRSSEIGDKANKNLVMYSDKESKFADDEINCCHIEWRLSGVRGLEFAGIRCVDDLISFDHQRFWINALDVINLPKKETLGELAVDRSGGSVSGSALRKSANKLLDEYRVNGNFVLHNLLIDFGLIKSHVSRMDSDFVFKRGKCF